MFQIQERRKKRMKGRKKRFFLRSLPTFWMLMILLINDFFVGKYGYSALDWGVSNWILFALNFRGDFYYPDGFFSMWKPNITFSCVLSFLLYYCSSFIHSSLGPSHTVNSFGFWLCITWIDRRQCEDWVLPRASSILFNYYRTNNTSLS